jgi:parvulin-like peptidyl-prolyl isomerase
MLPEFEEATLALAEGEISGIVENDYGFHIIERIPVTPNSLVEYTSADEQYDLRYTAALDMFDANLSSWIDEAEVVYAGPFENFDLASVF